ncbi:MAG TPA: glutaminyl-peptide cyclotransferase [Terracidiphilus sp.]|nr:glutaminyl-peptide cyclotransferase [Terracidiphilus sp.]
MMRFPPLLRALPLAFLCTLVASQARCADSYRIVHTYPHDKQAFTQGLVFVDGHLYESTGLVGSSSLRMEDVETGRILKFQSVPENYFAEGLTNWGSTLIQLTWKAHTALVYDRSTFRFLRSMHYPGEGWGLTQDGKSLILSDGTATLRILDPVTFRELRRINVRDHGKPVTQLNELEWIHGQIYANVWHSNRIARISPATGNILGWIDLTGLLPAYERSSPEAVLNGIAWDAVHDRLFVTGKLWPKLFEIQVIPGRAKVVTVQRHK